jgi:hypothetical protein
MFQLDTSHPFYRPLWRRVAIPASCAVWAGVEFLLWQNGFFGSIAAGLAVWLTWALLIQWKEPAP